MKRWLAVALLAGVFAGCGKAAPAVPPRPSPTATVTASGTNGGRQVTDMTGRSVSLPEEVRTVVALSPAAADYAAAIGLEVLGRTSDTPADVAPTAKLVGSAISPDFNAIEALAPDLVLADAAYQAGRTRDFDRFSRPVYMLKANSFSEVLAALTAMGEATGHGPEAAAARDQLETRAEAARGVAAARGGAPRVLVLTGGGRDVFGGGSATYIGSLLEYLGATNVLGSVPDGGPIPGFGVIDVGAAAALAPEAVLILPSGQGGLDAQIKADRAWAGVPAVKQDRVAVLDTSLFLRAPGPRAGEALEKLVAVLWR